MKIATSTISTAYRLPERVGATKIKTAKISLGALEAILQSFAPAKISRYAVLA